MQEVSEGYVVDIACLRKYPRHEALERAREHSRACLLMGHCVESGYGLVSDDGRMLLLDMEATPKVVAAVQPEAAERGIRIRAAREPREEEMVTRSVELLPAERDSQ